MKHLQVFLHRSVSSAIYENSQEYILHILLFYRYFSQFLFKIFKRKHLQVYYYIYFVKAGFWKYSKSKSLQVFLYRYVFKFVSVNNQEWSLYKYWWMCGDHLREWSESESIQSNSQNGTNYFVGKFLSTDFILSCFLKFARI